VQICHNGSACTKKEIVLDPAVAEEGEPTWEELPTTSPFGSQCTAKLRVVSSLSRGKAVGEYLTLLVVAGSHENAFHQGYKVLSQGYPRG